MTPLRFYVFPRSEVERLTRHAPIPREFLSQWEVARPSILDDDRQDIFSENCRSKNQQWKDFRLFEQTDDPERAEFIVCQHWTDLFEATGLQENIELLIDSVLAAHPAKRVVFSWNHDMDAAQCNSLQNLPARAFVLNYNTSRPTPNDILLPFWTINTDPPSEQKNYKAGFIGYAGTKMRSRLGHVTKGKPGYYFSDTRMPESEYLRMTSSFRFSLCPRGGGLNSWRFYESIHCGSVPVLFGDDAVLPFPELNYSRFAVQIPERSAGNFGEIDAVLGDLDYDDFACELEAVRPMFSLLGVQQAIYERLSA